MLLIYTNQRLRLNIYNANSFYIADIAIQKHMMPSPMPVSVSASEIKHISYHFWQSGSVTSRYMIITYDASSCTRNHLCKVWKLYKNHRGSYRADVTRYAIFQTSCSKVMATWTWNYKTMTELLINLHKYIIVKIKISSEKSKVQIFS